MRNYVFLTAVVLVAGICTLSLAADVAPSLINYQAMLRDSGGDPVNGTHDLTFTIYAVASGGTPIWTETHTGVTVEEGMLSLILGSIVAIDDTVFKASERWLGVQIGTDAELIPRTRLVSVPYSHRVNTIDLARAGTVKGDMSVQAESGDEDLLVMSTADGDGALHVTATDAAKATERTILIAPADNIALKAIEGNGDETMAIITEPSGAMFHVTATDVAKGLTSSVRIDPADSIALLAQNHSGDSLISLSTRESSGRLTLTSNTAKGLKRIEIKEDGIYFYDETRSDTTMAISADGNITGKGKVAMGDNMENLGAYSNCLGWGNIANGDSSSVLGGTNNETTGRNSTVVGGKRNKARSNHSAILAGSDNEANAGVEVIAGGIRNMTTWGASHSFIGCGMDNVGGGTYALIGTGHHNTAGDSLDPLHVNYCVVLSGAYNKAFARQAFVGNGDNNLASAQWATVLNGQGDTASGEASVCAGGRQNVVSGHGAAIGGGGYTNNHPAGNTASGELSVIPGGTGNEASGLLSYAAGRRARATHNGTFMWADTSNFDFTSAADNEFAARATGGVRFVSGLDGSGVPNAGVTLAAGGGSWSSICDRNAKENFEEVELEQLLEKLADMEVSTWNYKSQDEAIRHIGPMAQDFHAAFGVGEDNKHITTIDGLGVAFATIKALYRQNQKLQSEVAELDDLRLQVASLQAMLEKILSESDRSAEGESK